MDGTPLSRPASRGLEPESGKSSRQTSCSECHRLKLKCNKQVPCGSCVRRGCASICPTGTLRSTGRGKRSVLSEVPELTTVITEMGERIRQLEHAVSKTHDGGPSSHHPLLSNAPRPPDASTPAQNAEILGSFSVNEAGHAVYFGPTAGSEALFSIEGASGNQSPERESISFMSVTESFPLSRDRTSNWDADQALEQLFAHLPLEVRAWSLCGAYYQNGCWTGMPIVQEEVVELLALIYRPLQDEEQYLPPVTAQQLAVLYLILALGALVDLDLPPYSSEADHYFDLGCAAMSVKSVFENPTVVTVQGLVLIAMYYAHGGRRFTMDGAWSTISLACSISQTLGLHRVNFGSKLSPTATNRCRALFWETYSIETIYGLSVGRPTGTFLSNISCPFPPDEDPATEPFVKINPGYKQGRWGWTTQVTAPIMETFLTTAKPSYETVLALDEKIRKYMFSAPFESFPSPENSPAAFMQRNLVPLFSKIMLMYIHSGSFVEAMRDNPIDPLASSYAASFLAGYRSASEIIKADIRNFTTHPMLFTRWWAIWKSLFNAAIIVGTVATKYPSSKMAPHAIVELFTAVDLIEKGAVSSGRARSGLAILQRLRDKAIAVYSQYSGHRLTPPPASDAETEDELEIFAGYTRVVANKVLSYGLPRVTTPPLPIRSSPFPSSPPTHWPNDAQATSRDFDPSIVEYFAHPNSERLFGNMGSLLQPSGIDPIEDAGFFFTFPPNYVANAVAGSDPQQTPSAAQEMQWARFLQSL